MKKKANASPQRKSGLMQLLVPLIAIAALLFYRRGKRRLTYA